MLPLGIVHDDDRLMSLVDLALAQPAGERQEYLRTACDGDPVLFAQAWHYVEWEERMGGFLLDSLYSLADLEFQPGQLLLDDRFRIVAKIGEGGMGVVYEAMDEKLGRRIAIKCAKAGFRKRLPPEVRHATEISHPNVCKIFEIHTAVTAQGEIDFLTMELLEGETLSERLRTGPLPEKEARIIAQQLAAGLAAAHRCGVIHGDLKSSNIILSKDAARNTRVVITDFGLARGPEAVTAAVASGSFGGASGGTPDYMAPELWKGEQASLASDIYALGAIVYEMLSGTRLPGAGLPWEQRLTRKPPSVHPKWNAILARCLDPDPARRYRTVDEISHAIAPGSRKLALAAAAGVVLVVASAAVAYQQSTKPGETVRLAMLPFETDAPDGAFSGQVLKDTATHLNEIKSSSRRLIVLPPDRNTKNATHVLTVAWQHQGGQLAVRATVSDTGSLQLEQWQAEFEPSELRFLPLALAGVVTGALHLPPAPVHQAVNAAAASDFQAGVELARREDRLDKAIPLLEHAVAADSDSPLTYARLAEALSFQYTVKSDEGLLERAKASLKQAQKRNPDLALVWLVSGMVSEYSKSFTAADADLQRARELDPGNADVWRHLGGVYLGSNRLSEAESAYRKAIDLDPRDFRNYQDLCRYYVDHGKYEDAVRLCQQAIALAPDLSAVHFTAAIVHGLWGSYAEAEREAREALRLDPMSKSLQTLAIALVDQGKYVEAVPLLQRAVESDSATDIAYSNLGSIYRLAGQPQKAREAYQKAAGLARSALRRNLNDATVRSHLAYVYARLGDRQDAEYEADQAVQLAPGSLNVAQFIVLTYEALDERQQTLDFASKMPHEALRRLQHDEQPDLADLHKDSRFQQLIKLHNIQ